MTTLSRGTAGGKNCLGLQTSISEMRDNLPVEFVDFFG